MVSADVKHHLYLLPLGANGGDCVVAPSDRKGCEFCELPPLAVEIVLAILIVKDASSVHTITAYIVASFGCS